jgi:carboxymethylenebutenolidase
MQKISFAVDATTTSSGILAPGSRNQAVVVIHEWWGINANIEAVCSRISRAGFTALAPDLYHGVTASTPDQANELMSRLNFARAVEEIRGAARHLHNEGATEVHVLGFCMGGALTLLAALRATEFKKAVCFYGIPAKAAGDLSEIKIPVLAHFANRDDWCTSTSVDELQGDFFKGGVQAEIHRYDAAHAFANEKRPEVYDAAAADLAWKRTFEFLER